MGAGQASAGRDATPTMLVRLRRALVDESQRTEAVFAIAGPTAAMGHLPLWLQDDMAGAPVHLAWHAPPEWCDATPVAAMAPFKDAVNQLANALRPHARAAIRLRYVVPVADAMPPAPDGTELPVSASVPPLAVAVADADADVMRTGVGSAAPADTGCPAFACAIAIVAASHGEEHIVAVCSLLPGTAVSTELVANTRLASTSASCCMLRNLVQKPGFMFFMTVEQTLGMLREPLLHGIDPVDAVIAHTRLLFAFPSTRDVAASAFTALLPPPPPPPLPSPPSSSMSLHPLTAAIPATSAPPAGSVDTSLCLLASST